MVHPYHGKFYALKKNEVCVLTWEDVQGILGGEKKNSI